MGRDNIHFLDLVVGEFVSELHDSGLDGVPAGDSRGDRDVSSYYHHQLLKIWVILGVVDNIRPNRLGSMISYVEGFARIAAIGLE